MIENRFLLKALSILWIRKLYLRHWQYKQRKKCIAIVPLDLIEEIGEKEIVKIIDKNRSTPVESISIGSHNIGFIRRITPSSAES